MGRASPARRAGSVPRRGAHLMPNMKPGFHRDARAIGRIAKRAELRKILHDKVAPVAEKAGGRVDDYTTDRAVSALIVDAADQARDGAATKAAGEQGWEIR